MKSHARISHGYIRARRSLRQRPLRGRLQVGLSSCSFYFHHRTRDQWFRFIASMSCLLADSLTLRLRRLPVGEHRVERDEARPVLDLSRSLRSHVRGDNKDRESVARTRSEARQTREQPPPSAEPVSGEGSHALLKVGRGLALEGDKAHLKRGFPRRMRRRRAPLHVRERSSGAVQEKPCKCPARAGGRPASPR